MIINCICGKKKFKIADEMMPAEGSKVRCGSCSEVWFYHPNQGNLPTSSESSTPEENFTNNNFEETSETNYQSSEENITEEPSTNNSEELLPDADGEELLDKDLFKDENFEENDKAVSKFKIFSDDEGDLPSKEEMDKNLDNLKIERDKSLNFFQRIFKKDRMKDARKALKKKHEEEKYIEKEENNTGRRTRLLFYLLILLTLVFMIALVPIKDDVSAIFPFMKDFLDFLVPMYDHTLKFLLKL